MSTVVLDESRHQPLLVDEQPMFNNGHVLFTNIKGNNPGWIEATPEVLELYNLTLPAVVLPALDSSRQSLVLDDDGSPLINEGCVVVYDSIDNIQFEAQVTDELCAIFNIARAESAEPEAANVAAQESAQWRGHDDAVRQLIFQWHKHEKLFQSSSIKNDEVWAKIAAQVNAANPEGLWNFTAAQCKDKIKYIRGSYTRTKDWNKNTGNDPKTCSFYEEMDEILGDKPCVSPVAISSSMKRKNAPSTSKKSDESSSGSEDNNDDNEGEAKKKIKTDERPKKKTKVQKEIESWTQTLAADAKKREEAREARFERGLQVYQDFMQKLIDKL